MSSEDRRAPGAIRVPFEALVEVGGSLGPSFEAQAIDISDGGMHLRTAYLPEVGQTLSCRFEAGVGSSLIVAGQVVWKQEASRGGEFAIQFLDLSGENLATLGRILGTDIDRTSDIAIQAVGSRVRLHIDGLGSPMRARVKEASGTEITACSELGFLQVGKQIELEDASSGGKRPASIDQVMVEVDQDSRIPQLVITLKYDDELARARAVQTSEDVRQMESESILSDQDGAEDTMEPHDKGVRAPEASQSASEIASIRASADQMKGAFARGASKVGPAFSNVLRRAKVTMALLAAKRKNTSKDETAMPARRTTAPAPDGGLHTSGRKVVRGEPAVESIRSLPAWQRMNRKKAGIAAGVVGLGVLTVGAFYMSPATTPASISPESSASAADASVAAPDPLAQNVAPPAPAPAALPQPVAANTMPVASPLPDPIVGQEFGPPKEDAPKPVHKRIKVTPFGNGPVAHGNVLRIKMDGAIEKIEGASQPTGFTVVIPSRRSLEAASPLASRDSRIASIRVANDPNGAELSLAFKDGVPNYQVRARGDMLEIVLAPIGAIDSKKIARTAKEKHTETAPKSHGKGHKSRPH